MPSTNSSVPAGQGNEITFWGRLAAGVLLIVFTAVAITTLMAFWPNKMPDFSKGDDGAWYTRKMFDVTLIEDSAHATMPGGDSANIKAIEDSIKNAGSLKLDSATVVRLKASMNQMHPMEMNSNEKCMAACPVKKIHLNTILLLLVALMGFLGNMVHIASSFTSYVGNNTFKRSWILWYFVKPFTAAGLALIVYFIIRAGFFSYGSGAAGISLYGILSMSALAGLFTDSATLKLKEVFEVIFKTRDDRKDKLNGDDSSDADTVAAAVISTVSPESISAAGGTITITGTGLDEAGIIITMAGTDITSTATISAEKIELTYTPTAEDIAAGNTALVIADSAGKTLNSTTITVTQ